MTYKISIPLVLLLGVSRAAGWPGWACWAVGLHALPGSPRHERAAWGSVQLRRDGVPAATCSRGFMAGMTAGWVTGTAPPACPRRWETRCRQVTRPGGGWF